MSCSSFLPPSSLPHHKRAMRAPDDDWIWVFMLEGAVWWRAGGGDVVSALKWAINDGASLGKEYTDGEIIGYWENPWA